MAWDIESVDGVAVVTMNTNKVNVQNAAFFEDLHDAFDRLERDHPRDGVVLTARGTTFSAGIDLKAAFPLFATGDAHAVREFFTRYRSTNMRLFTYPRITVAAVNGHAFAGGLITALCCDFRIAADGNARYSLNEVPIGIPMPGVYVEMIRYAIGCRHAALATLSGDVYTGSQAVQLGFVDDLVPEDHLPETAIARARSISADAGPAYAYSKRALQAPTLANIRALADEQDHANLPAVLVDPATLRAQDAKYRLLTGRSVSP